MVSKIISGLSMFFIINSVICIIIIILDRRKPERTIAWLLLFIVLPPVGLVLYIFLGWNWKKHKLNSDQFNFHENHFIDFKCNKNDEYNDLMKMLKNSSNSSLFENNEIQIFNDGNEKFHMLKKELKKAKHHIHLEYYIVRDDITANEIKDILIEKSKEGVKVKFIIDKVGAIKIKRKFLNELRNSGVEVIFYTCFLAPIVKFINTQVNFRNHRKIVVIDGKVGFTGGMNIGDEYVGKGKLGYWRDTHMMIKGDAVSALQSIFIDDYYVIKKAGKKKYDYYNKIKWNEVEEYFPESKRGDKKVQIIKSGPDSKNPVIMHAILKMINDAKDHIYIITPYFVPSESILTSLKMAAISGIDVRIIFPGRYDHFHVYYASRTYLKELAGEGVKIYFYDKNSFVHSKIICVDSKICSVGTTNMDIRSYELNYEVNAVIYDQETTINLEKQFYCDLKKSDRITIEDFNNMPFSIKLIESITRVFSNIL